MRLHRVFPWTQLRCEWRVTTVVDIYASRVIINELNLIDFSLVLALTCIFVRRILQRVQWNFILVKTRLSSYPSCQNHLQKHIDLWTNWITIGNWFFTFSFEKMFWETNMFLMPRVWIFLRSFWRLQFIIKCEVLPFEIKQKLLEASSKKLSCRDAGYLTGYGLSPNIVYTKSTLFIVLCVRILKVELI